GWRSKILLTGGDRIRWMNGMVTNNIRDLAVSSGNYNFLLSPQGRIQADMYIYNRGEYLLVDTARWQAAKVLELFEKFIIMDDVEVTDASDKLSAIAVQGPNAREVLSKAGFQTEGVEPLKVVDHAWGEAGYSITRMASNVSETYELWMSPANLPSAWNALISAGTQPAGTTALEMFRVWAGIPRYGQDIRERELPQETEQAQALHFSKGCYVGQEIVERIHARGQVHRKFSGFVVEGAPPELGTKILTAGKEVGEITSALSVPAANGRKTVALGYIRREAGVPGTLVQAGETIAVVSTAPFDNL
ncbi:MAG: folate-binding protein YgfZ, partial [Candidatus Korobacteraceae bacterium]